MCDKCYVLKELFRGAESNSHQNYIPTLAFVREMVKQDRIEIFAGDCPLEEVEKHLSDEIHYTISHYLKCKSCNQYFFIGACIRGIPIYETKSSISSKDFDNLLWGRYGTKYA